MNTEEAKVLVNKYLKQLEKECPSFFEKLMSPELVSTAMAIPTDIIMCIAQNRDLFPYTLISQMKSLISRYSISSDAADNQEDINIKRKIKLLKDLKKELDHNVNMFEKVDIKDFKNALSEVEEKRRTLTLNK